MKIFLKFDMDVDRQDYDLCINGGNYYSALFDVAMMLRKKRKHGKDKYSIEELEREFYEILEEKKIEL